MDLFSNFSFSATNGDGDANHANDDRDDHPNGDRDHDDDHDANGDANLINHAIILFPYAAP